MVEVGTQRTWRYEKGPKDRVDLGDKFQVFHMPDQELHEVYVSGHEAGKRWEPSLFFPLIYQKSQCKDTARPKQPKTAKVKKQV